MTSNCILIMMAFHFHISFVFRWFQRKNWLLFQQFPQIENVFLIDGVLFGNLIGFATRSVTDRWPICLGVFHNWLRCFCLNVVVHSPIIGERKYRKNTHLIMHLNRNTLNSIPGLQLLGRGCLSELFSTNSVMVYWQSYWFCLIRMSRRSRHNSQIFLNLLAIQSMNLTPTETIKFYILSDKIL